MQIFACVVHIERRSPCSQRLHAPTAGIAGCLGHAVCRFQRTDDGAANADAEPALLKALLRAGLTALSRLGDGNVFCHYVDITLRSNHITACLAVLVARHNGDIARHAAYGRSRSAGLPASLIGALLLHANGKAYAATRENAAFFLFTELAFAAGFKACGDGYIVLGHQAGALI